MSTWRCFSTEDVRARVGLHHGYYLVSFGNEFVDHIVAKRFFRIGLCITHSFPIFCFLSFLAAITTVTPQLMLPLVGGLAPPHRKATAISIVFSGLLLGVLIARLVSGIMTEYTDWRNVYWLSLGLQYLLFCLLWLFMPHYPSANPDGLNYFKMLWSIVTITYHEPLLVQACIIGFLTSAIFTSYWTTLTFLLASPPFEYSTIVIGLFSLIGIASLSLGPVYSRFLMNKFVPLFSVLFGEVISLAGAIVGTYTGTLNVAGLVIEAFAIDLGMQITQNANRNSIYAISSLSRNRVNTAYIVSVFCGQLMGTAAGNHLYAQGGWIKSGSANVGFVGVAMVISFLRGPWESRWIGWQGGWNLRPREPRGHNLDIEKNGGVSTSKENQQRGRNSPTMADVKAGEIMDERQCEDTHGSADENQNVIKSASEIDGVRKRELNQ